ncbi:MAG: hypothetical protein OEY58_19485 [Gammaproteobacteria bacterium]|nr:hypothetical protein [Gammaproteobacteria bacterium]
MTLDWSIEAGQGSRARPYTSIDFINNAYDDIVSDGLLDGLSAGGVQLMIGNQSIDANTYHHDIAVVLMRHVDNTRNQTGFTREQMLPAALVFNGATDAVYAGVAPIDIDEDGAVITNFTPAENSTVSGDAMFSVDLYCTTGVQQAEFFIDNVHYSYSFIPISLPPDITATKQFYVPLFQSAGTSGLHTLRVEATCVGGTVTSQTNNNVTFDNL